MEHYLAAIARIYERHWLQVDRDATMDTPAVSVHATIPTPELYKTFSTARSGVLTGQLDPGQLSGGEPAPPADGSRFKGFHCQLFEGWSDGSPWTSQDGDFLEPAWNYSCENAMDANFWYNQVAPMAANPDAMDYMDS